MIGIKMVHTEFSITVRRMDHPCSWGKYSVRAKSTVLKDQEKQIIRNKKLRPGLVAMECTSWKQHAVD